MEKDIAILAAAGDPVKIRSTIESVDAGVSAVAKGLLQIEAQMENMEKALDRGMDALRDDLIQQDDELRDLLGTQEGEREELAGKVGDLVAEISELQERADEISAEVTALMSMRFTWTFWNRVRWVLTGRP